jgi:hypothetical protein
VREKSSSLGVGGGVARRWQRSATVAARGCHGTTRAEPRRLKDREATASASRGDRTGGVGAAPEQRQNRRRHQVETLAVDGVGSACRGGAGRSNRQDRVDQEAAVQWRLVVVAGATGAGGRRRERRQRRRELASERRVEAVVGQV